MVEQGFVGPKVKSSNLFSHNYNGSYGQGGKTLGFQLRDKSSTLFGSDGRVILSICIRCNLIGYNGDLCIKPRALCFLTYCGLY